MTAPDDFAALVGPGGCVVTIGAFDGVHRGHQVLLDRARAQAQSRNLPLVAVTFDPHPMAVVGPKVAPPSLASLDQRVALLREHGADAVRVLAFDQAMSELSADEFVERLLVDELGAKAVVVGEDFRFGHRAQGSVGTLLSGADQYGFDVTAVPLVGDATQRWSSTHARQLIEAGDVRGVQSVLGRTYAMEGVVVHGDHRGRELGFPTANLSWSEGATVPADGVYAGRVHVGDQTLPAAVSVGTNPQFAGIERRVEAYVLDRDDLDLYGSRIVVEFVDRIRGQQRFASVDDLIAQMGIDVEQARAALGRDG